MKGLLFVFLILVIASQSLCVRITPAVEYEGGGSTFDVLKYGAIGDGNTDDTEVYNFFLFFLYIVFMILLLLYKVNLNMFLIITNI